MRIGICDDEPEMLAIALQYTRQWAAKSGYDCDIETFASANELLFMHAEKTFDILLLDIQMPGMDGIALSRKIREQDERVQLVFITSIPDFIGEGYEVAALHYLLKPVNPEKLSAVLDRACKNLKISEAMLTLQLDGEIQMIPLREISYLEAKGHYVTLYTDTGVYEKKSSMQDMFAKLDSRFYRCQRSFAVNLYRIRKVSRTEVELESGERLPLSRGLYDDIHHKMIQLYPEGLT